MSIKGLKQALERKKAQQHPEGKLTDGSEIKIIPTTPVRAGGNKPQKKVTGRGR